MGADRDPCWSDGEVQFIKFQTRIHGDVADVQPTIPEDSLRPAGVLLDLLNKNVKT